MATHGARKVTATNGARKVTATNEVRGKSLRRKYAGIARATTRMKSSKRDALDSYADHEQHKCSNMSKKPQANPVLHAAAAAWIELASK